MELKLTRIAGCLHIHVHPIQDRRGFFTSVFDLGVMRGAIPEFEVVRMNRSLTRHRGTIRGLHFQHPPHAENKLVQCIQGTIFDVCLDLRPSSATYLQWAGVELSAHNEQLLLIPEGCAHGFQTLAEDCVVEYLVTAPYSPPHEGGLRWNDPALDIAWPLPCTMTSERDAAWPLLPR